ncbi:hypothetical protein ACFQ08_07725 [Streptosporangium algeriense]|uniref:Uncharacterized protein n=1 Tax=Streptosporangium algeriense TaxID=1682748 RepID=A0ABW3DNB4_9ACTN
MEQFHMGDASGIVTMPIHYGLAELPTAFPWDTPLTDSLQERALP